MLKYASLGSIEIYTKHEEDGVAVGLHSVTITNEKRDENGAQVGVHNENATIETGYMEGNNKLVDDDFIQNDNEVVNDEFIENDNEVVGDEMSSGSEVESDVASSDNYSDNDEELIEVGLKKLRKRKKTNKGLRMQMQMAVVIQQQKMRS